MNNNNNQRNLNAKKLNTLKRQILLTLIGIIFQNRTILCKDLQLIIYRWQNKYILLLWIVASIGLLYAVFYITNTFYNHQIELI